MIYIGAWIKNINSNNTTNIIGWVIIIIAVIILLSSWGMANNDKIF